MFTLSKKKDLKVGNDIKVVISNERKKSTIINYDYKDLVILSLYILVKVMRFYEF